MNTVMYAHMYVKLCLHLLSVNRRNLQRKSFYFYVNMVLGDFRTGDFSTEIRTRRDQDRTISGQNYSTDRDIFF